MHPGFDGHYGTNGEIEDIEGTIFRTELNYYVQCKTEFTWGIFLIPSEFGVRQEDLCKYCRGKARLGDCPGYTGVVTELNIIHV